jgi:hypothetical protein
MLRRALAICLVLAACGPAAPTVATVQPVRPAPTARPAAPASEKSPYPTPPEQAAPWSPPKTSLDASVVSAAAKLFERGLADPRGLEYREVELTTGDVWSGGGGATKTHAWVIPRTSFAVAWNGLVYRARSVGARADLYADVKEMLDADDAARRKAEHDNPGFGYHRFPDTRETDFVATQSVVSTKALLLLRLGDGDLAARVWKAARGDNKTDPYVIAAGDWLWALYDRGVTAHMRGDGEVALESLRRLPDLAKAAAAECAARKQKTEAFKFLDGVADVLADEQRRAAHPERKMDDAALAALTKLPQKDRIARLVDALDQVAARQMGQPGGVVLGEDPIVQALIKEGEAAVEPLLAAYENDTRVTRSVQFWRDFARYRSVLAVYEAAYVALSGILDTSFFQAVSTGDHLTARGVEGRRALGKQLRAYWAKWKDVPMEERFYRILADDHAGADQWLAAAQKITQPTNVQVIPSSSVFSTSMTTPLAPGQKPALRGESLRKKTSPSVSQLFATRLGAMPDARRACSLARAFADWDPKAASPRITAFERATIHAYAASNDKTFAGSCIAALTTARAAAGDASALSDYGRWIVGTKPEEASFDLEQWLAPMVASPTSPAIVRAAGTLFSAPSPWIPFVSATRGYELESILGLDLLKLAAFRRHVVAELKNRRKIGTIVVRSRDTVEVKTAGFQSSRGIDAKDPLTPPDGTTMDLRVCDEYAASLASSANAKLPPFRIYHREADRDRALAAIVAALEKMR